MRSLETAVGSKIASDKPLMANPYPSFFGGTALNVVDSKIALELTPMRPQDAVKRF